MNITLHGRVYTVRTDSELIGLLAWLKWMAL